MALTVIHDHELNFAMNNVDLAITHTHIARTQRGVTLMCCCGLVKGLFCFMHPPEIKAAAIVEFSSAVGWIHSLFSRICKSSLQAKP